MREIIKMKDRKSEKLENAHIAKQGQGPTTKTEYVEDINKRLNELKNSDAFKKPDGLQSVVDTLAGTSSPKPTMLMNEPALSEGFKTLIVANKEKNKHDFLRAVVYLDDEVIGKKSGLFEKSQPGDLLYSAFGNTLIFAGEQKTTEISIQEQQKNNVAKLQQANADIINVYTNTLTGIVSETKESELGGLSEKLQSYIKSIILTKLDGAMRDFLRVDALSYLVERWILIANQLRQMGNDFGASVVYKALTNGPIKRISESRNILSDEAKSILQHLSTRYSSGIELKKPDKISFDSSYVSPSLKNDISASDIPLMYEETICNYYLNHRLEERFQGFPSLFPKNYRDVNEICGDLKLKDRIKNLDAKAKEEKQSQEKGKQKKDLNSTSKKEKQKEKQSIPMQVLKKVKPNTDNGESYAEKAKKLKEIYGYILANSYDSENVSKYLDQKIKEDYKKISSKSGRILNGIKEAIGKKIDNKKSVGLELTKTDPPETNKSSHVAETKVPEQAAKTKDRTEQQSHSTDSPRLNRTMTEELNNLMKKINFADINANDPEKKQVPEKNLENQETLLDLLNGSKIQDAEELQPQNNSTPNPIRKVPPNATVSSISTPKPITLRGLGVPDLEEVELFLKEEEEKEKQKSMTKKDDIQDQDVQLSNTTTNVVGSDEETSNKIEETNEETIKIPGRIFEEFKKASPASSSNDLSSPPKETPPPQPQDVEEHDKETGEVFITPNHSSPGSVDTGANRETQPRIKKQVTWADSQGKPLHPESTYQPDDDNQIPDPSQAGTDSDSDHGSEQGQIDDTLSYSDSESDDELDSLIETQVKEIKDKSSNPDLGTRNIPMTELGASSTQSNNQANENKQSAEKRNFSLVANFKNIFDKVTSNKKPKKQSEDGSHSKDTVSQEMGTAGMTDPTKKQNKNTSGIISTIINALPTNKKKDSVKANKEEVEMNNRNQTTNSQSTGDPTQKNPDGLGGAKSGIDNKSDLTSESDSKESVSDSGRTSDDSKKSVSTGSGQPVKENKPEGTSYSAKPNATQRDGRSQPRPQPRPQLTIPGQPKRPLVEQRTTQNKPSAEIKKSIQQNTTTPGSKPSGQTPAQSTQPQNMTQASGQPFVPLEKKATDASQPVVQSLFGDPFVPPSGSPFSSMSTQTPTGNQTSTGQSPATSFTGGIYEPHSLSAPKPLGVPSPSAGVPSPSTNLFGGPPPAPPTWKNAKPATTQPFSPQSGKPLVWPSGPPPVPPSGSATPGGSPASSAQPQASPLGGQGGSTRANPVPPPTPNPLGGEGSTGGATTPTPVAPPVTTQTDSEQPAALPTGASEKTPAAPSANPVPGRDTQLHDEDEGELDQATSLSQNQQGGRPMGDGVPPNPLGGGQGGTGPNGSPPPDPNNNNDPRNSPQRQVQPPLHPAQNNQIDWNAKFFGGTGVAPDDLPSKEDIALKLLVKEDSWLKRKFLIKEDSWLKRKFGIGFTNLELARGFKSFERDLTKFPKFRALVKAQIALAKEEAVSTRGNEAHKQLINSERRLELLEAYLNESITKTRANITNSNPGDIKLNQERERNIAAINNLLTEVKNLRKKANDALTFVSVESNREEKEKRVLDLASFSVFVESRGQGNQKLSIQDCLREFHDTKNVTGTLPKIKVTKVDNTELTAQDQQTFKQAAEEKAKETQSGIIVREKLRTIRHSDSETKSRVDFNVYNIRGFLSRKKEPKVFVTDSLKINGNYYQRGYYKSKDLKTDENKMSQAFFEVMRLINSCSVTNGEITILNKDWSNDYVKMIVTFYRVMEKNKATMGSPLPFKLKIDSKFEPDDEKKNEFMVWLSHNQNGEVMSVLKRLGYSPEKISEFQTLFNARPAMIERQGFSSPRNGA